MPRFMVTCGGTKIVEAATMEAAAKKALDEMVQNTYVEVDVTDIDVGNRKKVMTPNIAAAERW